MTLPAVLLFDLGGVLVEYVGLRELAKLVPGGLDPTQIRLRSNASQAVVQYEIGACSRDEFARRFIDEWELELAPKEFLALYAAWLKPPFPGALDLLAQLRTRFTIACLSNTNELHWQLLLGREKLRSAFDRHWADENRTAKSLHMSSMNLRANLARSRSSMTARRISKELARQD